MNIPATVVMNQEFTDLDVIETSNPYRTCIQGLANEAGIQGLGDYSQAAIVERLATVQRRATVPCTPTSH